MILIVDHQDSFTRNLEHLLANFDRVSVIDRKEIKQRQIKEANVMVVSRGAGEPDG